jgi:hypothetical protein
MSEYVNIFHINVVNLILESDTIHYLTRALGLLAGAHLLLTRFHLMIIEASPMASFRMAASQD